MPLRVLGSGCNMLVRDEGVRGVVLRLSEPAFTQITVEGKRVRTGTGAAVSALDLAGGPARPGRSGNAGRHPRHRRRRPADQRRRPQPATSASSSAASRCMDSHGRHPGPRARRAAIRRTRQQPRRSGAADGGVRAGDRSPDAIVKRMRKAWIQRKATQPLSFQSAGRIFKNPRGLSAAALIEQAGLAAPRVGGAEVSDRDAELLRRPPRRQHSRRAAPDRPGAQPRQGTVQRRSGT